MEVSIIVDVIRSLFDNFHTRRDYIEYPIHLCIGLVYFYSLSLVLFSIFISCSYFSKLVIDKTHFKMFYQIHPIQF